VIQDSGERQAAIDKATGKLEKILAINYYYKSSKPQYNDMVKKILAAFLTIRIPNHLWGGILRVQLSC
jgi:hypothetical protein